MNVVMMTEFLVTDAHPHRLMHRMKTGMIYIQLARATCNSRKSADERSSLVRTFLNRMPSCIFIPCKLFICQAFVSRV